MLNDPFFDQVIREVCFFLKKKKRRKDNDWANLACMMLTCCTLDWAHSLSKDIFYFPGKTEQDKHFSPVGWHQMLSVGQKRSWEKCWDVSSEQLRLRWRVKFPVWTGYKAYEWEEGTRLLLYEAGRSLQASQTPWTLMAVGHAAHFFFSFRPT